MSASHNAQDGAMPASAFRRVRGEEPASHRNQLDGR